MELITDLYNCKCLEIRFPNQAKRQISVTFKISMYSDFLDEIKNQLKKFKTKVSKEVIEFYEKINNGMPTYFSLLNRIKVVN